MIGLLLKLPLWGQLLGVAAVVGTIWGAHALYSGHYYKQGYTAAINGIAAQDKEAVDAANAASANRRNCLAGGGVWSTPTGQCGRR